MLDARLSPHVCYDYLPYISMHTILHSRSASWSLPVAGLDAVIHPDVKMFANFLFFASLCP